MEPENERDKLTRVESCWNGKAEVCLGWKLSSFQSDHLKMWNRKIGTNGDWARIHSDPILFSFLGEVAKKKILDAGCGTGKRCNILYLFFFFVRSFSHFF
jgi:hypothetical protein